MSNKVYYFCTKYFKGSGMTYYNELRCIRLLGNDCRIPIYEDKYYTIGNIHKVDYGLNAPNKYDIEWEKEQVKRMEFNQCYDKAPYKVVIEELK